MFQYFKANDKLRPLVRSFECYMINKNKIPTINELTDTSFKTVLDAKTRKLDCMFFICVASEDYFLNSLVDYIESNFIIHCEKCKINKTLFGKFCLQTKNIEVFCLCQLLFKD